MSSATHITELTDSREVLFSYGIPVAAYLPHVGYVQRVDLALTQTMQRHVYRWTGGSAEDVDLETFRRLVAPVEVR